MTVKNPPVGPVETWTSNSRTVETLAVWTAPSTEPVMPVIDNENPACVPVIDFDAATLAWPTPVPLETDRDDRSSPDAE